MPSSNDNTNPFRVAIRHHGGRRPSHGDCQAAGRVGLAVGHMDDEGLPVSPLRTVLPGEEVAASAHHDRVRQTAEAQVPVLSTLHQVQGRRVEAHRARSSGSAVTCRLIVEIGRENFIPLFIYPAGDIYARTRLDFVLYFIMKHAVQCVNITL